MKKKTNSEGKTKATIWFFWDLQICLREVDNNKFKNKMSTRKRMLSMHSWKRLMFRHQAMACRLFANKIKSNSTREKLLARQTCLHCSPLLIWKKMTLSNSIQSKKLRLNSTAVRIKYSQVLKLMELKRWWMLQMEHLAGCLLNRKLRPL